MAIDYEQAAQIFKDKCRQEGRIITISEFKECEDLLYNLCEERDFYEKKLREKEG